MPEFAGLNPRTRVPEARMLTTRLPKPSCSGITEQAAKPCSVTTLCRNVFLKAARGWVEEKPPPPLQKNSTQYFTPD